LAGGDVFRAFSYSLASMRIHTHVIETGVFLNLKMVVDPSSEERRRQELSDDYLADHGHQYF
jgi:hypothetical protein